MATCVNMVISLLPELNPRASFCGEDSESEKVRGTQTAAVKLLHIPLE